MLVAALFVATSSASPHKDPSRVTCDGKQITVHVSRARALLREAYDPDNAKPDRSLIEQAQSHRRCVLIPKTRHAIGDYRKKLKARWEAKQSWCSPTPAPDGGGCWEIPEWCVQAESGGSWTAHNPTSPARGPYQLNQHGEPWPVTTREQAMEHHRIAAQLYASSGLQPWVAC